MSMKLYTIQTYESDEKGIICITWHKHLFIFKDHAIEEAMKMGPSATVLELTQTDSWNHEQMKYRPI